MYDNAAPQTYDVLLQDFKGALGRALAGQLLLTTRVTSDTKVLFALLDIADAVRRGQPAYELVLRACEEFSAFAAAGSTSNRTITALAQ